MWYGDFVKERKTYYFTIISWVLVIAWAVLIFLMSANTGLSLSEGDGLVSMVFQWLKDLQAQILPPGVDIVNPLGHFCEYAIFGGLLANAWRTKVPLSWAVWAAVCCASLYGISDEIHQVFVPGRTADPIDWLVDTCAATLGAFVAYGLTRYVDKRRVLRAQDGTRS